MTSISQVLKRYPSGFVDYLARIYLGRFGRKRVLHVTCRTDELVPRRWRLSATANGDFWELRLNFIRPGTALFFRLELDDGSSVPFVPLGESDVVNGVVRVPDYHPSWLEPCPTRRDGDERPDNSGMAILLEQTLEGLLADYEEGVYFTDSAEELLSWSVADRLLQTKIPERLRDLGYTELMFPLYASVADRCNLNPKFNYLVYNISTDWQLGTAQDLRKLVHRFRACGIELVPDLVFVHQVKNPFDGSSNDVMDNANGLLPWQDPAPFLFRNYGTWHFDLEDPVVRAIMIDKLMEMILSHDFHVLRVDYMDGLLLQYSGKSINYGAVLLEELSQRLHQDRPGLRIIGEAFQTAAEPSLRRLIDSTYSPRGFGLLDLLLVGAADLRQATRDAIDGLTRIVAESNNQSCTESNYSQLHDECWQDEWISLGRGHTPWAYGAMPMGLALARVDALIHQGTLQADQRTRTAAALMLLIRTLGLVLSFTRWMETSGSISLDQGKLDDPLHWQLPWETSSGLSRMLCPANELTEQQRCHLIQRAQQHVGAANHLIRRLGMSEASTLGMPLIMVHGDVQAGVAAFVRWGKRYPNPVLVLVNLSPIEAAGQPGYEIDLNSAGWNKANHPTILQAHSPAVLGKDLAPLLLTQSRGSPGIYTLNRPLHAYESALLDVPIHDL